VHLAAHLYNGGSFWLTRFHDELIDGSTPFKPSAPPSATTLKNWTVERAESRVRRHGKDGGGVDAGGWPLAGVLSPDELCQPKRVMRGGASHPDELCRPNGGRGVPAFCRDKGRMWGKVGALCLSWGECDRAGMARRQGPAHPTPDKHKAPASSPLIPLSLQNETPPPPHSPHSLAQFIRMEITSSVIKIIR